MGSQAKFPQSRYLSSQEGVDSQGDYQDKLSCCPEVGFLIRVQAGVLPAFKPKFPQSRYLLLNRLPIQADVPTVKLPLKSAYIECLCITIDIFQVKLSVEEADFN